MYGPVDSEDIAALASLIQDFDHELGIELRIDEPTRLRTRLLNAGTQVDLRSLLLDETEGFMEEPTWHFLPAQPTTRYFPRARREVTQSTVTRRIIPLKRRWSSLALDRPTDEHVHLFVRRRDGETKQTPIVNHDDIVEMVINLSEPASQDVVTRITDAIGEALGPECEVDRLAQGESPDEVYLQSIDEMSNLSSNLTGCWFEEGLRAERLLQLGPGTGPLPALYEDSGELPALLDDWEEDDSAWHTVSHTGGPGWVTFMFTVLVVILGLSFFRTDSVLEWLDRRVSQLVAMFEDDVPIDRSAPRRIGKTVRPSSEQLQPQCRWSPGGPVFEAGSDSTVGVGHARTGAARGP
jgi:hypothetical protein